MSECVWGGKGVPSSYSVLSESIIILPPVSGLSVDSDAGAPPSAPPGIVNAGGFFFDMILLKITQPWQSFSRSCTAHTVIYNVLYYLAVLKEERRRKQKKKKKG